MTGKTLLVVNPRSGKCMAKKVLLDIVSRLSDGGCTVTVFPTKPGDVTTRRISEIAPEYDLVVACGGDGTLNAVTEGILQSGRRVPVGYIPLGSTNDFAASMGLPTDHEKAAETVIAGTPRPHDIGCFGNRHFTYIACCGAFTETSYNTSQSLKNIFGHGAYVLNLVNCLSDIHPMELQIETNEETVAGKFIFFALANTTTAAGFIRLDGKEVDFADGLFELITIRYPKDLSEGRRIATKLLKGDMNDPAITIRHTSYAKVVSGEPVGWSLDGENGGKHKISLLSVEKNAFDILK